MTRDDGPVEAREWPCQADGCVDGQVPARKFDKHGPTDCAECQGLRWIRIEPGDFINADHEGSYPA